MKAATYYKSCFNVKEIEKIGDKPMQAYIKALGKFIYIHFVEKFLRGYCPLKIHTT